MEYSQLNQLKEELNLIKKGTSEEINYNVISMGLETIPTLGPLASYFYKRCVTDPVRHRICEFLEELLKFLEKVEKEVNTLSLDSPAFQDHVIRSLDIISRNHQQKKRIALRNLIANSALPNSPIEDIQSFFINLIDEFQVSHLILLEYCRDLDAFDQLEDVLPDVKKYRGFYNQVLKDLSGKGLIKLREKYVNFEQKESRSFDVSISRTTFGSGVHPGKPKRKYYPEIKTIKKEENVDLLFLNGGSRTTELGDEFLNFIKNPLT